MSSPLTDDEPGMDLVARCHWQQDLAENEDEGPVPETRHRGRPHGSEAGMSNGVRGGREGGDGEP